jgi:hypothetical protein
VHARVIVHAHTAAGRCSLQTLTGSNAGAHESRLSGSASGNRRHATNACAGPIRLPLSTPFRPEGRRSCRTHACRPAPRSTPVRDACLLAVALPPSHHAIPQFVDPCCRLVRDCAPMRAPPRARKTAAADQAPSSRHEGRRPIRICTNRNCKDTSRNDRRSLDHIRIAVPHRGSGLARPGVRKASLELP